MRQYIEIVNWDSLQHYKTKDGRPVTTAPTWIKNYVKLLHKDEYLRLTGHQRGVLHGLWILYAVSGCEVVLNPASLSSQLGLRVTSKQLEALSHAGFIRFYSRDVLEQSREEEIRKTQASKTSEISSPRDLHLHLLKSGNEEKSA